MSTADLDALIASLPPLTFAPAAEAPVSLTRWYLVVPDAERRVLPGGAIAAADVHWRIAHNTDDGWFCQEGSPLDPLVVAALPRMPGQYQAGLKCLAAELEARIEDDELDAAERLLEELRDELRAARRLAGR